jgi:hypothetical protein
MLLYKTGSYFTPHRDTEKEGGMFETMIIQLPSAFTGGDVTVCHQQESQAMSLSEASNA